MISKEPKVALIDGDFILYYSTHPKKLQEDGEAHYEEKSFEEVVNSANSFINEILLATGCQYYIGALTAPNCFRYQYDPEYKGNRKGKPKPNHFYSIKRYLIEEKGFITHVGLEADDIVNIIRWNIREFDPLIVSNDKDILSLEGTHYNPVRKVYTTTDEEEASLKFWTDMITGQTGDNIKGLKGKGPEFAKRLFAIEDTVVPYHQLVLSAYIAQLKEEKGIDEFYKNYKCLKILEDYEGFNIPQPVKAEIMLP